MYFFDEKAQGKSNVIDGYAKKCGAELGGKS
jgi:hypothetical protein